MEDICFCARCLHFGYDVVVEDVLYYDAIGKLLKDYPVEGKRKAISRRKRGRNTSLC
jgi:predicted RNA-binding protein